MIVDWIIAKRLMEAFPGSFIVQNGEFIAHRGANEFFNLSTCKDELEVKCKVLEYLSRGAYKTAPFRTDKANQRLWDFMRSGINSYLGTSFTHDDMDVIYTYLGNGVNRAKTIRFIESGYDMRILSEGGTK